MNVYAKLAKARVDLQSKDIKKTGKNVKFNYMELEDFLPLANVINNDIGLVPVFSIANDVALLTIYNTEGEDSITFTSPTAHAKLQGGASPIQELGAQHTYMRRYLYLLAYEICENDALGSQEGDNTTQPEKSVKPQPDKPTPIRVITPNEAADMLSLCSQKGVDIKRVMAKYEIAELGVMQFDMFTKLVANIEKMEDKK